MAILTFNNFRGVNLAEDAWKQNFGKYVMGVDVIGMHNNNDTDGLPGVLQGLRVMAVGTEAGSPNEITDLCRRFALNNSVSSNAWALGDGLRVYERVGTTWTKRYAGAGVDFVAARNTTDGGGLLAFQDSLWVVTNGDVNRLTAPTGGLTAPYNDGTNNANFSSTTSSSRPSLEFEEKAYFGNNNFVSSLSGDSTPIWTQKALTLDSEWTIESMAIYSGRIYIAAQNGSFSRVFSWDGSSLFPISTFNVFGESTGLQLIYFDGRLWAISIAPTSNNTQFTNIYIFDGASFQKFLELPAGIHAGRDGATIYDGNLLIGSTESSNIASYGDGVGGIWTIGKKAPGQPYEPVLAYNPSNGVPETTIGGIFAVPNNLVFEGTTNNSSSADEIWELQSTDQQTAGIWSSNPIDAGLPDKPKMWHGIQLNTELDQDTYNSNRTITISYKVDQASSFTTLTTVRGEDSGTYPDPNRYIPIGVTGRNIEIRIQINTSGSVTTTQLRGFSLEYSEATR